MLPMYEDLEERRSLLGRACLALLGGAVLLASITTTVLVVCALIWLLANVLGVYVPLVNET